MSLSCFCFPWHRSFGIYLCSLFSHLPQIWMKIILFFSHKVLGKHPSFGMPSKNYTDRLYIVQIPDVYKSSSLGFLRCKGKFFLLFFPVPVQRTWHNFLENVYWVSNQEYTQTFPLMEVMPVIVMAEEKHHLISHCCPDCITVAWHRGKGSIFPRHAFLERPAFVILLWASRATWMAETAHEIQTQMDSCEAKGWCLYWCLTQTKP